MAKLKLPGGIELPALMLLAAMLVGLILVVRTELTGRQQIAVATARFERNRSAYDQCVSRVKKSRDYGSLLDLALDGICPPRPSDVLVRGALSRFTEERASTWRNAATLLGFAALPWVVGRLAARKAALNPKSTET